MTCLKLEISSEEFYANQFCILSGELVSYEKVLKIRKKYTMCKNCNYYKGFVNKVAVI